MASSPVLLGSSSRKQTVRLECSLKLWEAHLYKLGGQNGVQFCGVNVTPELMLYQTAAVEGREIANIALENVLLCQVFQQQSPAVCVMVAEVAEVVG